MDCEHPDVQAGFRKSRRTRDQIANIFGSLKNQETSRKTTTSDLLTMPKSLTVWITAKWRKFFKRWNTRSPHLPPEKSIFRSRSKTHVSCIGGRILYHWATREALKGLLIIYEGIIFLSTTMIAFLQFLHSSNDPYLQMKYNPPLFFWSCPSGWQDLNSPNWGTVPWTGLSSESAKS